MKIADRGQQIRQGDVLLTPVETLPAGAQILADRVGIKIDGERTGHAHQLVGAVAVLDGAEFIRGGNVLTHEEHEHVATAGDQWYRVRVQREYAPVARPTSRSRRD